MNLGQNLCRLAEQKSTQAEGRTPVEMQNCCIRNTVQWLKTWGVRGKEEKTRSASAAGKSCVPMYTGWKNTARYAQTHTSHNNDPTPSILILREATCCEGRMCMRERVVRVCCLEMTKSSENACAKAVSKAKAQEHSKTRTRITCDGNQYSQYFPDPMTSDTIEYSSCKEHMCNKEHTSVKREINMTSDNIEYSSCKLQSSKER